MKTLYLVHKTHLDIGFTDLAANVTRQYLDQFIPAAIERAEELNHEGETPGFIWTTGAWVIWKALETYGSDRRHHLEKAIRKGWITWHALPFTFHTELLGPGLLHLALAFAKDLDARFGHQTIAAKMTDVPGHTAGMVPVLANAGISFLHIGVNAASRVPDVPPLFRWQAGGSEIIVAYAKSYGSITQPEQGNAGLAFLHTHDNLGPPPSEHIKAELAWLQQRHPGTTVQAGTMDEFARSILPLARHLPVITSEIGDTWIHGVASDPLKLADFAALRQVVEPHARALAQEPLTALAPWLEPLLLTAEHTWGVDAKTWLSEHSAYFAQDLAALRHTRRFSMIDLARDEQRGYIQQAVDHLPANLRREADTALARSRAARQPAPSEGWTDADRKFPIKAGRWLVRIQPGSGTLATVFDTITRRDLCPDDGRLAWAIPRYELYGADHYNTFLEGYMGKAPRPWWAEEDFRKMGLHEVLPAGMAATIAAEGLRMKTSGKATRLRVTSRFRGEALLLQNAPSELITEWTFHHDDPCIELSLRWSAKVPTRLPEAGWIGFRLPAIPARTRMRKLGLEWDPADVVTGGGRHLHALDGPVQLDFADGLQLEVTSHDALLYAPCGPHLLVDPEKPYRSGSEIWFNLFNNVWNTNFPLWFGEPMGYRFTIRMETS